MKRQRRLYRITRHTPKLALAMLLAYALLPAMLLGQATPRVAFEMDTLEAKIGGQFTYTLTVEADSTAQVIFPEGQTFSPLETVEASAIDTIRHKDRRTLQRSYALTQWDSGQYTVPAQRIDINGQGIMTDSAVVHVTDVVVDTTKQKMYDIKGLAQVQKPRSTLWSYLLPVLLGIILVAALLYWFVFRKKPMTEEERRALLPPYERALKELEALDRSKYLIQDEYKAYYTELTDIVRSYLEEDVHVSALESTTDQLIERLEMLTDAGELALDADTLDQFKRILKTADLAKFARLRPGAAKAEEDRKAVEQIVKKTHEALPEPTEEELMQQQEYQEQQARLKRQKRLKMAVFLVAFLLTLAGAAAIARYGFTTVKDNVLGHPNKELLDGEWVYSTYGYPPISIETPKVLLRQRTVIPRDTAAAVQDMQRFGYASELGSFAVQVSAITYAQDAEPAYEKAVEQYLKELEAAGVKNILTKQEEFTTASGVQGTKVYGSGKFPVPNTDKTREGQYAMLLFGGKGFLQQVALSWPNEDTYAEKMTARILNSVDVATEFK